MYDPGERISRSHIFQMKKKKVNTSIHCPRRVPFQCFESCSHTLYFPVNGSTFIACPTQRRYCLNHENTSAAKCAWLARWTSFIFNQIWERLIRLSSSFQPPYRLSRERTRVPFWCWLAPVTSFGSLLWNLKVLVYQKWLRLPPRSGSEERHDANGAVLREETRVKRESSAVWPYVRLAAINCFWNFHHI